MGCRLVKVRRQAQQRDAFIAVLFDLTGPRSAPRPATPISSRKARPPVPRKEGTEPTVEKSTTVNYDG
jgi:hypothetical protein